MQKSKKKAYCCLRAHLLSVPLRRIRITAASRKADSQCRNKKNKTMKKILMTLAAVAVAATMNAQVYVGGGIGFQTSSNDGNTSTTIKLIPEVGYTLDENWAVGIALGYAQNNVKVGGEKVKVKVFQVSPYARWTFVKFDRVNLFVDGGVSYQHEDADGTKTNDFGVGLKPGVAVNLTDKLSFVTHVGFLGYTYSKLDVSGAKATNSFGFDLDGNNLTFGLYYNF